MATDSLFACCFRTALHCTPRNVYYEARPRPRLRRIPIPHIYRILYASRLKPASLRVEAVQPQPTPRGHGGRKNDAKFNTQRTTMAGLNLRILNLNSSAHAYNPLVCAFVAGRQSADWPNPGVTVDLKRDFSTTMDFIRGPTCTCTSPELDRQKPPHITSQTPDQVEESPSPCATNLSKLVHKQSFVFCKVHGGCTQSRVMRPS